MEPVPPPTEPQSIVDAVRGELTTLAVNAKRADTWASRRFAAIADALLILLPETPPPGKHVVDDVQPIQEHLEDSDVWEWRDKCIVWWDTNATEWSDGPRPIALLTGPGREWMTIADARTLAAHLLSAAARAERAPGHILTDQEVADVAVASRWIEDTPEARAAYLAGQADQ